MKTQLFFRDYNPNQLMLFPTDLKQCLPEDDLVYFLIDVVDQLNIEPTYRETIQAYIATEQTNQLSKTNSAAACGRIPKSATITERMTRKLQTIKGCRVYEKRKQIVEPVFGQIKEVRRFRRFSFRGLKNVAAEWDIICLTHNLLKLYRSGWQHV